MTGGSSCITDTAPPLAHAVGGSLGSALALLLLYPLERARVELQTTQGSGDSSNSNNRAPSSSPLPPPQDINDKVKPLQAAEQQATSRSRGGAAVADFATKLSTSKRTAKDKKPTKASGGEGVNDELDEERQKPQTDLLQQGTTVSPASSWESLETSTSKQEKRKNNKLGLVACLCQLHQRKQLYRGVTPVVTTLAVSNFVFFYCHSFLKQLLLPSTSPQTRGSGSSSSSSSSKFHLSLLASCLAGIVNVLLTNPLWVANLRIVTAGNDNSNQKQHQNLWREIKDIIHTEGWEHLWNGTPASLLLVSNPVIQFVAYEHLKNRLLSLIHQKKQMNGGTIGGVKRSSLKPLEAFILGAIAKAISTVLTYPLQLAQTVLRVQKQGLQNASPANKETEDKDIDSNAAEKGTANADTGASKHQHTTYRSTLDCLLKTYRHKGIEGWFAGMRTKLLQTVLTAAFTFLTYEQIIRVIMTVHRGLLDKRHRKQMIP